MVDAGTALLQAIILNPAENEPRLQYSDWLQEQGQDERAEFIRVQCELSSFSCRPSFVHNMRKCRKCVETDRIWEFVRADWFGEAAPLFRGYGLRVIGRNDFELTESRTVFRLSRGFLESVTCTAEAFLAHADGFIWHPDQTVECPVCRGESRAWQPHTYCPGCGNKNRGRVSRPCPPGAHPVRQVTLTTPPRSNKRRWLLPHPQGREWREVFAVEWPKIEFTAGWDEDEYGRRFPL